MSLVLVERSGNSVLKMAEMLNGLFVKKISGDEDFNSKELECLSRMEHSKLLRVFIHPQEVVEWPIGYVPPRMELEMVYSAVTGEMVSRGMDQSGLVRFAFEKVQAMDAGVISANK